MRACQSCRRCHSSHAEKKGHRSLSSLTNHRRRKSPSLACVQQLPLSVLMPSLVMCMCACMYICAVLAVGTYSVSSTVRRAIVSSCSCISNDSKSNTPATLNGPALPSLSVTPHAFDEFVRSNKSVPCVLRAVCTVPRRGCEHAKAPAVICSPDGASVRAATWQSLALVGPRRWVVEWSTRSTAAGRRPLVSQRRGRDRSRPDRPQRAVQRAQSASKPWHGALWLNALPSHS